MQRDKPVYGLKKCYPILIWTECDVCEKEFRREHGWSYWNGYNLKYICEKCGPTRKDAENIIHEFHFNLG